jgi:hypothetical protein
MRKAAMKSRSGNSSAVRLAGIVEANLPAMLAAILGAVLIVTVTLRPVLSADALLPAVTTLLFGAAAATGAGAMIRGRSGVLRDVAGLLTFLGVVAAALIEPDQMMRLVSIAPDAD